MGIVQNMETTCLERKLAPLTVPFIIADLVERSGSFLCESLNVEYFLSFVFGIVYWRCWLII